MWKEMRAGHEGEIQIQSKKEGAQFISDTNTMLYLTQQVCGLPFNWILVWDWKRQRPIVVAAERGMTKQEKDRE